MLRYRSDLLKTLGTLLFLPAFLSGAAEQKQVLEVELFSEYIDDPVSQWTTSVLPQSSGVWRGKSSQRHVLFLPQYSPSVASFIEIMSSKVQIYSSHLYVHAHFTGIRWAPNIHTCSRPVFWCVQHNADLVCLHISNHKTVASSSDWFVLLTSRSGPQKAGYTPWSGSKSVLFIGSFRAWFKNNKTN